MTNQQNEQEIPDDEAVLADEEAEGTPNPYQEPDFDGKQEVDEDE